MRGGRTRTPGGRRIWRLELAITLAVIVVLGSIGYYRAVHFEGNERFSRCTIVSDAFLVLDYSYGSGDEVVTYMNPEQDKIVVGVRVHSPGGTRPAIELQGRAQYLLFSGFKDRPVVYDDGRVLSCGRSNDMPK